MIKFSCSKCGQSYKVPNDYIGKTVKCKKCGYPEQITANNSFLIKEDTERGVSKGTASFDGLSDLLQNDAFSGDSVDKPSKVSSASPMGVKRTLTNRKKILMGSGIAIVILAIAFFTFRDTWEVDNFDHIVRLEREAREYAAAGSFEEAINKYNELFLFVKDRSIELDMLANIVGRAELSYEDTKVLYEKRLYHSCVTLMEEADGLEQQWELVNSVQKHREIMRLSSNDLVGSKRLRNLGNQSRMKQNRLNDEVAKLRKEEEEERRLREEEKHRAELDDQLPKLLSYGGLYYHIDQQCKELGWPAEDINVGVDIGGKIYRFDHYPNRQCWSTYNDNTRGYEPVHYLPSGPKTLYVSIDFGKLVGSMIADETDVRQSEVKLFWTMTVAEYITENGFGRYFEDGMNIVIYAYHSGAEMHYRL